MIVWENDSDSKQNHQIKFYVQYITKYHNFGPRLGFTVFNMLQICPNLILQEHQIGLKSPSWWCYCPCNCVKYPSALPFPVQVFLRLAKLLLWSAQVSVQHFSSCAGPLIYPSAPLVSPAASLPTCPYDWITAFWWAQVSFRSTQLPFVALLIPLLGQTGPIVYPSTAQVGTWVSSAYIVDLFTHISHFCN